MIQANKALVLFCEGPHDVAFCNLIFKKLFSAQNLDRIRPANPIWRLNSISTTLPVNESIRPAEIFSSSAG